MPPATVYQTRDPRSAAVPRQSLRARSKCDSAPGPPGAGPPGAGPPGAGPGGGAACAGDTATSNAAAIPDTSTNAGNRMGRIRPPPADIGNACGVRPPAQGDPRRVPTLPTAPGRRRSHHRREPDRDRTRAGPGPTGTEREPDRDRPGPVRQRLPDVVVPVGQDVRVPIDSIDALVGAALALGADRIRGWSAAEGALAAGTPRARVAVGELRDRVRAGEDPLGEAFARIRGAETRRALGQTYTPAPI